MIHNGCCSGRLVLLQAIFNSTRAIKAEDDEIPRCLEHWELQKKVAGFLSRVISCSSCVDQQLLHYFEGGVSFLETTDYGNIDFL